MQDYIAKAGCAEIRRPRPHVRIVAKSRMASNPPPDVDRQSDPAPTGDAEILPFRSPRAKNDARQEGSPASPNAHGEPEPLSTKTLIGIGLLVIFLITTGVWLIDTLRDIGKLQDCAMQGRRNCATITVPSRDR